jgi:deazaflavin-dependent oxidoreductase (nitroreductase family)
VSNRWKPECIPIKFDSASGARSSASVSGYETIVPLSRTVARLNRAGLNHLTRHVAPYIPGFGVVEHRGRRSGKLYRTPVNVFRAPGGFRIALTYGADAEWVRNVLAAGGAVLHTRGRRFAVDGPRLEHDERRRAMPVVVRQILGLLDVSDFLRLHAAPAR